MIDPDGIQIQRNNLPSDIHIKEIPEFETQCYNIDDEKGYKKFIMDVERDVRRSFEYREFIKYIRENMDMNKCSFLSGVTNDETYDIKIEIHHYPFTLHDIVEIVLRKRQYYKEALDLHMVSKEVMILHYKLLVGLIPLSETVHEITHSARLFIPIDKVMGRYDLFINLYKPFCDSSQLDVIRRIENYTETNSDLLDTTVLNQTNVTFKIENPEYMLPDINNMKDVMVQQIQTIKDNNYLLPTAKETKEIESGSNTEKICPIYFLNE